MIYVPLLKFIFWDKQTERWIDLTLGIHKIQLLKCENLILFGNPGRKVFEMEIDITPCQTEDKLIDGNKKSSRDVACNVSTLRYSQNPVKPSCPKIHVLNAICLWTGFLSPVSA